MFADFLFCGDESGSIVPLHQSQPLTSLLFVIHTPEIKTNNGYYIHYSREEDRNRIKQSTVKQFNKGHLSSNAS